MLTRSLIQHWWLIYNSIAKTQSQRQFHNQTSTPLGVGEMGIWYTHSYGAMAEQNRQQYIPTILHVKVGVLSNAILVVTCTVQAASDPNCKSSKGSNASTQVNFQNCAVILYHVRLLLFKRTWIAERCQLEVARSVPLSQSICNLMLIIYNSFPPSTRHIVALSTRTH
jgi:hypothetical protein